MLVRIMLSDYYIVGQNDDMRLP